MRTSILIVDDETQVLNLLREFFTSHKFTVQTEQSAEPALDLLNTTSFDVVISGIELLGESDGFDFLRSIRRSHSAIPFIFLTGMGYDEELIRDSMWEGANGYVSKSSSCNHLLIEVRRVIRAHTTLLYKRDLMNAASKSADGLDIDAIKEKCRAKTEQRFKEMEEVIEKGPRKKPRDHRLQKPDGP